jgi:hypothetical protein
MHDYPIPNTLLVHLYQSPLKTRSSTSQLVLVLVLVLEPYKFKGPLLSMVPVLYQ